MEKISAQKLAEILGCAASHNAAVIDRISTDSRQISPTTLFIALKGERFDGHDFVADVIKNGCPLAVVERKIDGVPEEKLLIVADTLKAYGQIGAYNRADVRPINRGSLALLAMRFVATWLTLQGHQPPLTRHAS